MNSAVRTNVRTEEIINNAELFPNTKFGYRTASPFNENVLSCPEAWDYTCNEVIKGKERRGQLHCVSPGLRNDNPVRCSTETGIPSCVEG